MTSGLDGIVAAETIISHTDRARGMVWVRGMDIPTLVADYGFEGLVALLWEDFVGTGLTRNTMYRALGDARVTAYASMQTWIGQARGRPLYEGIRIALAAQSDDLAPAELASVFAVAVPALLRAERGQAPVQPDPALSVAGDVLRMLNDAPSEPALVAALDTYFTVMAESGLSGSSFTARVIASTRASVTCAVLGAWCAFTGPLHGGAPGPTLDLLDSAATETDLTAWLEAKLRAGERLMGFGHRVFHGNDPRAEAMRRSLRQMGPMAGRLSLAMKLEAAVAEAVERVKPGRKLPANVEIMAALLLDAVGIPRHEFTPVFAVGRSVGWIAHALEQQKTGRMIRPTSAYIGPPIEY